LASDQVETKTASPTLFNPSSHLSSRARAGFFGCLKGGKISNTATYYQRLMLFYLFFSRLCGIQLMSGYSLRVDERLYEKLPSGRDCANEFSFFFLHLSLLVNSAGRPAMMV
jgi:hypothetical protein